MFFQLLIVSILAAVAWVAAALVSFTLHEFGHACMARLLGDRTAQQQGRLTLNPVAHLDPVGFLMVLMAGFGWAKPVPFDASKLKYPVLGGALVGLAGPSINLILAALAAAMLRGSGPVMSGDFLHTLLFFVVLINAFLAAFNVLPLPPLDGSKLLFALLHQPRFDNVRAYVALRGPQVLIVLVLLSVLTPWNPFAFVMTPAFKLCDTFVGSACQDLLGRALGGG